MNKTEVIRAKCTPIERQIVELRAAEEGLKLSEYLRALVRQDAQASGIWADVLAEMTEQE